MLANLRHPFAQSLSYWALALPGYMGGTLWPNLLNPGSFQRALNVQSTAFNSATIWGPTTRIGGRGEFRSNSTNATTTQLLPASTVNGAYYFGGRTTLTVMFWLYPMASEAAKTWLEYGASNSFFSLEGSTTSAEFWANNTTSVGSIPLVVSAWNHVTLMLTGAVMQVFVNARSVGTSAFTAALSTSTDFAFGGRRGQQRIPNGKFDDLRIYNRYFSTEMVGRIMRHSSLGCPGMLRVPGFRGLVAPPITGFSQLIAGRRNMRVMG